MNRKTSAKRLLSVSVGLSLVLALLAGFCMHWLSNAQAVNLSTAPAVDAPIWPASTTTAMVRSGKRRNRGQVRRRSLNIPTAKGRYKSNG
jgi:predicted membrane protein